MKINILLNFGSWNTWLGILLFIVALGLLITIHELGHFIAAKSFKVYCSDFSIGFGPKILKIKRKSGETTFSVGIVPLGGYVSMAGEEEEAEKDAKVLDIPASRTIAGIKRWKRFIIFGAGIFMNFVLAYLIFFIASSCFPHYDTYGNVIDYNPTELKEDQSKLLVFDESGNLVDNNIFNIDNEIGNDFTNSNFFQFETQTIKYKYNDKEVIFNAFISLDTFDDTEFKILPFKVEIDGKEITYNLSMDTSSFGINNIDYSNYMNFLRSDKVGGNSSFSDVSILVTHDNKEEYVPYTGNLDNLYLPILDEKGNASSLPFEETYNNKISGDKVLTIAGKYNNERKLYKATLKPYFKDNKLESFNFNMYQYKYWLGWGSFAEAGRLWTKSCTAISEALGKLFIGQGWENIGGPVAILNATTTQLVNNPFYIYLDNWGLISVNLALFNLLPFPGLDGWQILVEIIEGIVNSIKKAKYNKAKKNEVKIELNEINPTTGDTVSIGSDNATLSIGETITNEYVTWKIPAKVKTIISYVGLGLLFLLAIGIFIKDIFGLF